MCSVHCLAKTRPSETGTKSTWLRIGLTVLTCCWFLRRDKWRKKRVRRLKRKRRKSTLHVRCSLLSSHLSLTWEFARVPQCVLAPSNRLDLDIEKVLVGYWLCILSLSPFSFTPLNHRNHERRRQRCQAFGLQHARRISRRSENDKICKNEPGSVLFPTECTTRDATRLEKPLTRRKGQLDGERWLYRTRFGSGKVRCEVEDSFCCPLVYALGDARNVVDDV